MGRHHSALGANKIIFSAIMSIIFLSILAVAVSGPNVYVSPGTKDTLLGQNFTINVSINSTQNVYAFDFYLYFNSSLINALALGEGNFLKKDGASTYPITNINNTAGYVRFSKTRFSILTGVSGLGVLATITFNGISKGSGTLTLQNVTLVDENINQIPNVVLGNGIVTVFQGIACNTSQQCGNNSYIGSPFCQNNDTYQNYRTYNCSNPGLPNSSCSSSDVPTLQQDCGAAGCSNGKCNIACYNNSDCGVDYWTGNKSCGGNDVLGTWRMHICTSPTTIYAACILADSQKLNQSCGNDIYSEDYCYDNDVYSNFTDRGCSNASCFGITTPEKVVECGDAGCDNGKCRFSIDINSPVAGNWYKTRSILLNVTLEETVKSLYYKINSGSWNSLCSNCNKYAGTKSFVEGKNNLTVRAITNTNQTYLVSIIFYTDTIKPKINALSPSNGYGNGKFGVQYTEANLKKTTLYYWPSSNSSNIKTYSFNCSSGTNIWCYDNVNLSAYNGGYIYYKFELKDNFFSVNSSSKKILVDTINPVMNIFKPQNSINYVSSDGSVRVNITLSEKVSTLQYNDNNLGWVSLCSGCTSYNNNKKFSFANHSVVFRATDYAGNLNQQTVSFSVSNS